MLKSDFNDLDHLWLELFDVEVLGKYFRISYELTHGILFFTNISAELSY